MLLKEPATVLKIRIIRIRYFFSFQSSALNRLVRTKKKLLEIRKHCWIFALNTKIPVLQPSKLEEIRQHQTWLGKRSDRNSKNFKTKELQRMTSCRMYKPKKQFKMLSSSVKLIGNLF